MKMFWALIAVLVLGAAVMALRGGGGEGGKGQQSGSDPVEPFAPDVFSSESAAAPAAEAEPATIAEQAPAATPIDAVAAEGPAGADPTPQAELAATPDPAVAAEPETPVAAEPEVAAAEPDAKADTPLPAELEQMVAATIGSGQTPAEGQLAAETDVPPADGAAAEASAAKAPTIVEQADGSKLINGRFLLKGEGTKAKPYEVSWDMLVSAQETYKPRLGQKTLPAYLDLINGKYVKVSGYIAFPLMAQSADEMLVMLNQWDGCCIGIPPTPYDAVEVRLRTPAEGETRFKVAGSVTGKFTVDPYLVKDWLIGLYMMEDAELTTEN